MWCVLKVKGRCELSARISILMGDQMVEQTVYDGDFIFCSRKEGIIIVTQQEDSQSRESQRVSHKVAPQSRFMVWLRQLPSLVRRRP